ncbi:MAG: hypothetical protein GTO04_11365, partial [Planctomycetales bacterium]|nr:hypothetical protein [Planctomycetales bacterium]
MDRLKKIERRGDVSRKWQIITHTDLGQAYDSLGCYEEAFAHFRQANELKPGRFDATQQARMIDDVISAFSVASQARLPSAS